MAIGFTDLTSTNRKPDRGYTRQTQPRVLSTAFGDGYSQRLIDGINPLKETINVSFKTRTKEEIDHIISFFESKGGVTAFTFTVNQQYYSSPGTSSETDVTSSDELALKVVCSAWNKTYDYADYWSATATFVRVYE
jgi:phage-related protein